MKISSLLCSLAVLMQLTSTPAAASSTSPGHVVDLTPVDSGLMYFAHDGSRSGPPPCAADPRWIVDPNAPGAPTINAALLSARTSGLRLSVQGTGSCHGSDPCEMVAWVVINN